MDSLRVSLRSVALMFGVLVGFASQALASSPSTSIPDVGVNLASYVSAFGTNLGTYIVVIVGLYFAYLAIRIGLKWSRRAA